METETRQSSRRAPQPSEEYGCAIDRYRFATARLLSLWGSRSFLDAEIVHCCFRKSKKCNSAQAKKINNLQAAEIDAGARIELAALGSCDSEHRDEPAAEDLRVEVFSGPAARDSSQFVKARKCRSLVTGAKELHPLCAVMH